MNINRDYIIIANMKTGNVSSQNMQVFNTDKRIMNIFVKLQTVMSNNQDIATFVTQEEATNYKLKLTVVKPKTNQLRYADGVLMSDSNGGNAVFQFDLPAEFTDQVGVCTCELSVTCTVNGNEESMSCDPFKYTVKANAVTGLNPEIEKNSDKPVLEELIDRVENLSGQVAEEDLVVTNYVVNMTKTSVQNVVLTNDTKIMLPLGLKNKEIKLNVSCGANDLVATFTDGVSQQEYIRLALTRNSYSIFIIHSDGKNFIIEGKSTDGVDLGGDAFIHFDEETGDLTIR